MSKIDWSSAIPYGQSPLKQIEGAGSNPDKRRGARSHAQADDHNIDGELEEALIELRKVAREQELSFEFTIDHDRSEIVVSMPDGAGKSRMIRQIDLQEARRLTLLLKAGRKQIMDRTI